MDPARVAVFEANAERLLLYARARCGSTADAEDVLQEALMDFLHAGTIHDPLPYLYRCIRSAALDWHRGEHRRSRREDLARDRREATWFSCSLQGEETRLRVEEALRGLPEEQREVVVLRVWGERSFPDIAAITGTSEDTTRSRYRYALDRLRGRLTPLQEAL